MNDEVENSASETSSQGLIPLESVNAVEIFGGNQEALGALLARIEADALGLIPDTSTRKGRDQIASTAWKVRRSKTTIDEAGKAYGEQLRKQLDEINGARREVREFLDKLADQVRKPLDDWQYAENERVRLEIEERERLEAEQKARRELSEAWDAAHAEDALWERERAVRREEERQRKERQELERQEAERIRKQKAAELEEERRREEERRIAEARKEAEEAARREAEEKIEAERQAKLRAEEAARKAEERRKLEAEESARLASEAAERAAREAQEAAKKAREDAEREAQAREDHRLAEERRREELARKAAENHEHRKRVNEAVDDALERMVPLSAAEAQLVRRAIAQALIPRVSIDYGRAEP